MARPTWTGQIEISLVSIAVKLLPATNPASEVAFHQIDRKTHQRIHHQSVADNSPVAKSDIVKGFEYNKGKYIEIEPKEIANLRLPTQHTLEIKQFVDLDEIPLELYEKPYFVVPAKEGQAAACAVIGKALQQAKKAAIGEIAFAGREHLVAITAAPNYPTGLMAYLLRYAAEMRSGKEYFSRTPSAAAPHKKQLEMANQLIASYSAPFQLTSYKDDYESSLRKLVEAKRKNKPLPAEEKPRRAKVINLSEALRQSIQAAAASANRGKDQRTRRAAKAKSKPRGRTKAA